MRASRAERDRYLSGDGREEGTPLRKEWQKRVSETRARRRRVPGASLYNTNFGCTPTRGTVVRFVASSAGYVEVGFDEAADEAELEQQRRSGAEPAAEHHVGRHLERDEHAAQRAHGAPVRDVGHANRLEEGGRVP